MINYIRNSVKGLTKFWKGDILLEILLCLQIIGEQNEKLPKRY